MIMDNCPICNQKILRHAKFIICTICDMSHHLKCLSIVDDVRAEFVKNVKTWYCSICIQDILPFNGLEDEEEFKSVVLESNFSGRMGNLSDKSFLYPHPTKLEGGVYWIHLVRPSIRPSVCRRHCFRSISQACFGILISNFICMLMVAIGRSLLIFSDVTFKMAAWWPYLIFWYPDSNFTLALNVNFKLQRHNTYVYG